MSCTINQFLLILIWICYMVEHSHLLTLHPVDAVVGGAIFGVAVLDEDEATTTTTPTMVARVVAIAAGSPTLVVVVKNKAKCQVCFKGGHGVAECWHRFDPNMCWTPRMHLLRCTTIGST
jgi:hypothetical protein